MMPWKLLAFIAVMAIVLVFIGFNLDNRCDISLVFVTFPAVPVVITILVTYILGLLSALVLSIGRRPSPSRRRATPRPDAQAVSDRPARLDAEAPFKPSDAPGAADAPAGEPGPRRAAKGKKRG